MPLIPQGERVFTRTDALRSSSCRLVVGRAMGLFDRHLARAGKMLFVAHWLLRNVRSRADGAAFGYQLCTVRL